VSGPDTTIETLERLGRIESLLEALVASVKRFEEFVLEVSPDEARADISELEGQL
jgi:hypothetical protein